MKVVYANEEFPQEVVMSIFLAGPTPREIGVVSWRKEALKIFEEMGYNGHVFVPEPRNGIWSREYYEQIEWEKRGMNKADCILFWIPRNLETLPAFTTNVEFGMWASSGKVVLGAPFEAPKMRYLQALGTEFSMPFDINLRETLENALNMVGEGAPREGGECDVPLYIWKQDTFQDWYQSQKSAGNRLDNARVEWLSWIDRKAGISFFWVLHVSLYITAEKRQRDNEVVIGRPPIACVMMYRKGTSAMNTKVVLVKESRSCANTADGFIYQLPGGSSLQAKNYKDLARHEVEEETGFRFDAHRLKFHCSRQLAATMSAHQAYLFSLELSVQEMKEIEQNAVEYFGVEEDQERTYVQIYRFREIIEKNLADWSTMGMICEVLAEVFEH